MGTNGQPILVPAPDFLIKEFKEYMIASYKLTNYQKTNDGYKYYCCRCGTDQSVTKDDFKKIKNTELCLKCFNMSTLHRKPYRKHFYKNQLFGWTDENGNDVGYYCELTENNFFCEQVAYWDTSSRGNRRFWARYVMTIMNGGVSYNENKRPNFTKRARSSYCGLEYQFCWIMEGNERKFGKFSVPRTYKEYLKSEVHVELKSNQLEMIKNNIFNVQQIMAIKYFDLKKPEDVFKNNEYINKCNFNDNSKVLNKYYLDYLTKFNINYTDFQDYAKDCEKLGYKLDKPKDFVFRSEQVGELVEIKNNEKYEKGVIKNYKRLKKNSFDNNKYLIKPLESVEEITKVAKHLHNCMARNYLVGYSKGETDLYVMKMDNVPIVAIEIKKGKLVQARSDHNSQPEPKYMKVINKWHKGISYEL